jgi:hypothetical protein
MFNVVKHSADMGCRDLPIHFCDICVEKLEGAERDPGRSSVMVTGQNFTHYLERFGNGL